MQYLLSQQELDDLKARAKTPEEVQEERERRTKATAEFIRFASRWIHQRPPVGIEFYNGIRRFTDAMNIDIDALKREMDDLRRSTPNPAQHPSCDAAPNTPPDTAAAPKP